MKRYIKFSYEEVAWIMIKLSKLWMHKEVRDIELFISSKWPVNKDIDINEKEAEKIERMKPEGRVKKFLEIFFGAETKNPPQLNRTDD